MPLADGGEAPETHDSVSSTARERTIDVLPIGIASIWMAIPTEQAMEILGSGAWVPVPAASGLIPGVLPWRGRPVAVLDLGVVIPGVPRLDARGWTAQRLIARAKSTDNRSVTCHHEPADRFAPRTTVAQTLCG